MKQLEITTNKRLLIVESENFDDRQLDEKHKITLFHNGNVLKFICKGPDLTEDIAYEIVDGFDLGYFVDYNNHNPRAYKLTALQAFISSIEASGYHWEDNPVKKPIYSTVIYGCLPGAFRSYVSDLKEWQEAESRTFNRSKCIIFEIL